MVDSLRDEQAVCQAEGQEGCEEVMGAPGASLEVVMGISGKLLEWYGCVEMTRMLGIDDLNAMRAN